MSLEALKREFEEFKEMMSGPSVVAKFHKVSLEQFTKDYSANKDIDESEVLDIYENVLTTPVRSSAGSAGHYFILTEDITLKPGESAKIFTGIRAEIAEDWVLLLAPRSGLGSKFRMQLNNTIGVIDSDYFEADNEGHIIATFTNDSNEDKELTLKAGDRFMQGFFVPYGITENDVPLGKRTGGFGSSGL